jgi:anti-anti-sigma regulatory factor
MAYSMTFRIETAARGRFTVFTLSGRIEKEAIVELRRLFESQKDHRDIVVDLKDVIVIDRDVVSFFLSCEADGVKLENCAPYIREWMEREKD